MGGIYGGLFFHLGASGRLKIFNREIEVTWQRKLAKLLKKIPYIWKFIDGIEIKLLNRFPPQIHKVNQRKYEEICKMLQEDKFELYRQLQSEVKQ